MQYTRYRTALIEPCQDSTPSITTASLTHLRFCCVYPLVASTRCLQTSTSDAHEAGHATCSTAPHSTAQQRDGTSTPLPAYCNTDMWAL
jgi:hypothetical protein